MVYPQKEEKRNVLIIKAASSSYVVVFCACLCDAFCELFELRPMCFRLHALSIAFGYLLSAICLELYALSITFGYVLSAICLLKLYALGHTLGFLLFFLVTYP